MPSHATDSEVWVAGVLYGGRRNDYILSFSDLLPYCKATPPQEKGLTVRKTNTLRESVQIPWSEPGTSTITAAGLSCRKETKKDENLGRCLLLALNKREQGTRTEFTTRGKKMLEQQLPLPTASRYTCMGPPAPSCGRKHNNNTQADGQSQLASIRHQGVCGLSTRGAPWSSLHH